MGNYVVYTTRPVIFSLDALYDGSDYRMDYGVKGQRWGVRRDRHRAASLNKKAASNKKMAENSKYIAGVFRETAKGRKQGGNRIQSAMRKNATKQDHKDAKTWQKESDKHTKKATAQSKKAKTLTKRANDVEKAAASKAKAQARLKKPAEKMSDERLRKEVKRLQMEENFHRLQGNKSARNATTTQRGKALAAEIIANSVKNTAQNTLTKVMTDAVNSTISTGQAKVLAERAARSATT